MIVDIRAGKRVLYKCGNSNWLVGTIMEGDAKINSSGLYIPIAAKGINPEEEYHWAEINQIFTDAVKLDDWVKDYPEYFMTKEDYIEFTDSENFDKARECAYISDGEYIYYPISRYSKNWIEKQPFEYVVRNN